MSAESPKHHFEDEWRKAFEDSEMLPPDDVWEAIVPQLPAAKKYPYLSSWWWGLAMVLLVSGDNLWRAVGDISDTPISPTTNITQQSALQPSETLQQPSKAEQMIVAQVQASQAIRAVAPADARREASVRVGISTPIYVVLASEPLGLSDTTRRTEATSPIPLPIDSLSAAKLALPIPRLTTAQTLIPPTFAEYTIGARALQAVPNLKNPAPSAAWLELEIGVGSFRPVQQLAYQDFLNTYVAAHQMNNVEVQDFFVGGREEAVFTPSYTLGLKYAKTFYGQWAWRTGIMYTEQQQEQRSNIYFTDFSTGSRMMFWDAIHAPLTNPALMQAIHQHPRYNAQGINTLSLAQFNTSHEMHIRSTYRLMSIPLQLGVPLSMGNRLSARLWLGTQANILLGEAQTARLSWAASLQAELTYQYNKAWAIAMSAFYQHHLQTLSPSPYIRITPRLGGISLGLRRAF